MTSENLFAEPGLKQITVWARGVYENKEARDVVVALTVIFMQGGHAGPMYTDPKMDSAGWRLIKIRQSTKCINCTYFKPKWYT